MQYDVMELTNFHPVKHVENEKHFIAAWEHICTCFAKQGEDNATQNMFHNYIIKKYNICFI